MDIIGFGSDLGDPMNWLEPFTLVALALCCLPADTGAQVFPAKPFSIVVPFRSWLLDLVASALSKDPQLATFKGFVSDSGEGRWTVQAAVDSSVPVPVLSAALFSRFSSRGEDEFANRLLSAMRKEFGGHAEPAEQGDLAGGRMSE